jgi:hypothetical protein
MDIGAGKTEQGVKSLAKAAPVIGSFPQSSTYISSLFSKE